MADILTLGELLIDLTQTGRDNNGCGVYTAFPGGAPANVAVAAARLGASAAFAGKVGNDPFGRSLAETLAAENVDTTGLYFSEEFPTTLAIVSVDETGEREFAFYRSPGADTQLTEDEAVRAVEKICPKILHVGSLSMTTSPAREACEAALRCAEERDILVSYDPNYRAALWDSEETAIDMMNRLMPYADILKVSDEEMLMLTGTSDNEEGSAILADHGISLVMVTLGADGVFVRYGDQTAEVPGFSVRVADTNGAGDTFLGAMLMQISKRMSSDGDDLSIEELTEMVTYANKAASLTCSRSGAIPAMPRAEEISG